MSDVTDRFEQAAKDVQGLASKPDNDTLLTLYALYKQGSEGDCKAKRPGLLAVVKRAKYDAWKERSGMSQEDAMEAYIRLVNRLLG